MARKPRGLFITGSDTGVGKTYVTALIAHSLRNRGVRVGVYKPVASGCRSVSGQLISDDAETLWQAAGCRGELEQVCPQRFAAPLAPHLAAAAEGRTVDSRLLRTGVEYWHRRSDVILVEGAGGLMSPLTPDEYNADLAFDLGYPLVIVVANRIGAINQALLTLLAAAKFQEVLPVVGIVLNQASADTADDPSIGTNARELAKRAVCPVLADLSLGANSLDSISWGDLAGFA